MKIATLAIGALAVSSFLDARAADYVDSWGPPVGSQIPTVAAPDQHGALRDVSNLSGENGLLLFTVRSADW